MGQQARYIFGGNTGLTPQDLEKRRAMIAAMGRGGAATLPGAATYLGENIGGVIASRRLDKREAEARAAADQAWQGYVDSNYSQMPPSAQSEWWSPWQQQVMGEMFKRKLPKTPEEQTAAAIEQAQLNKLLLDLETSRSDIANNQSAFQRIFGGGNTEATPPAEPVAPEPTEQFVPVGPNGPTVEAAESAAMEGFSSSDAPLDMADSRRSIKQQAEAQARMEFEGTSPSQFDIGKYHKRVFDIEQDLYERQLSNMNAAELKAHQAKKLSFYKRMNSANNALQQYEKTLASPDNWLQEQAAGTLPSGLINPVLSDDYRLASKMAESFIWPLLRDDTGAVINDIEDSRYRATYLPQSYDDERTLAWKRQARQDIIDGVYAGMHPDSQLLEAEMRFQQEFGFDPSTGPNGQGQGGGIVDITSPEEAQGLPPGTRIRLPNGKTGTVK